MKGATESTHLKPFDDEEDDDGKCCRNCHDTSGRDFIAPCACTGSIKWVHRSCLNEWRAVSPNPRSFTHCDICGTEYQMRFEKKGRALAEAKFAFLIIRDFTIALLINQVLVLLCSVFIWGIQLTDPTPFVDAGWDHPPVWFVAYIYGWLFFFFMLGCFGLVSGVLWLCGCCDGSLCGRRGATTYDTYNYGWTGYYFWFFYFPSPSTHYHHNHHHIGGLSSTDCSGCDCKGNSDVGDGLLYVLIALVVLIIILGIVFALVLTVLIAYFIVTRHWRVLRQRHNAGRWVVDDLSLPTYDVDVVSDV